jgi:hypothetical protein
MPDSRLIIRRHSPRRTLIIAALAAVIIALLVASYELGQWRAGFNRAEHARLQTAYERDMETAGGEIGVYRDRLARLETASKVDREAYRRVEAELLELQTRISQQEEDLAFYRGIVSPAEGEAGLRVQQFELRGGPDTGYNLRLVLAQALQNDKDVKGQVQLSVVGRQGGQAVTLGPGEIAASGNQDFSFRYFQELRADFSLPEGFEPEQVLVSVRPRGRGRERVEATFDWRLTPG